MSLNPVTLPPGRERLSTNPPADGVADVDEYDGNGRRLALRRQRRACTEGDQQFGPALHQAAHGLSGFRLARDPCDIEHDVAILDQANFSQTEPECLDERPVVRVRR